MIADQIRAGIIDGGLPAQAQLSEADLAGQLAISRDPFARPCSG